MPFLTLDNIEIDCHYDRGARELTERIRRSERLATAELSPHEKAAKRQWEAMTNYLDAVDSLWVEDLIDGKGETWLFSSKYSRNGWGPTSDSGHTIGGGQLSITATTGSFVIDLSDHEDFGASPQWTAIGLVSYVGDGSSLSHVAVTDQGLESRAGSTATVATWISEASGVFTIQPNAGTTRVLDYLHILPFRLPQAQMNEATTPGEGEFTVYPRPFLRLGGDCLRGRYGSGAYAGTAVLGERDATDYLEGSKDSDGHEMLVQVPFTLIEK